MQVQVKCAKFQIPELPAKDEAPSWVGPCSSTPGLNFNCKLNTWSNLLKTHRDLPLTKDYLSWRWQVPTTNPHGVMLAWGNVPNDVWRKYPCGGGYQPFVFVACLLHPGVLVPVAAGSVLAGSYFGATAGVALGMWPPFTPVPPVWFNPFFSTNVAFLSFSTFRANFRVGFNGFLQSHQGCPSSLQL